MNLFKDIISEMYQEGLKEDLLTLHTKHHAAGIPLPDRHDMYQNYPLGPVIYPKDDGGVVQHNLADRSIAHLDRTHSHHREDGPAIVSYHNDRPTYSWAKHGRQLAHVDSFQYADGTVEHFYSSKNKDGTTTTHDEESTVLPGWKNHPDLESFNKALADHGFPPHKMNQP